MPVIESGTTEYQYYRLTYHVYYLMEGLAVLLGFLVIVNRGVSSPAGKFLGIILCLAFGAACEYERRVFRTRPFTFRVDQTGITGLTLSGQSIRLLWPDIGTIGLPPFHEIGWRGPSVLLVSKTHSAKSLLIGKHLPGFSRLAERIARMTPGLDHSALRAK